MKFLTSRLFQLARSDAASYFIGFAFEYASSLIPIRRLFEDRTLIAFNHPVPFWNIHYLIVPKRRIPTFASIDLDDRQEADRLLQILQTAQVLGRQSGLKQYTVLVNGGAYQDVPQLHFHVASGGRSDNLPMYTEQNLTSDLISVDDHALTVLIDHPAPARAYHKLIAALDSTPQFWALDFFNPSHRVALSALLKLAQDEVNRQQLDRYTIVINVDKGSETQSLQLHLVSGDSIRVRESHDDIT